MLKWRLISAAVIVSGLLVFLYLDVYHPLGAAGVWLLPLALIVSALMVHELMDLWSLRPDRPSRWPIYIGAPLTVLAAGVPLLWPLAGLSYPPSCPIGVLGWPLLGMVIGIALSFLGEMFRYRAPGRSTGSIALSIFAIGYAGLLLSFLVNLRLMYSAQWGMAALICLIFVVKLSDTGAYFVGRRFGRHKMAPVLSPGKTWEGAAGGLAAACLGAWLCYGWIVPALVGPHVGPHVGPDALPDMASQGPLWRWLLLGLIVAFSGMLGDLAESLLKRDAERKDSSRWLPGLGGVLDILDSIVFAAAPTYYCLAAGLIGPGA